MITLYSDCRWYSIFMLSVVLFLRNEWLLVLHLFESHANLMVLCNVLPEVLAYFMPLLIDYNDPDCLRLHSRVAFRTAQLWFNWNFMKNVLHKNDWFMFSAPIFFSCQLKLKSISTYSLYINNPLWSHDKKKLCWISPKSSIQHRLSIQGTWLPEEDYLCMYIDLFLFRNWLEDSSKIVFITCQICRG